MEFGTDLINTICQVYVQTFRMNANLDVSVQAEGNNQSGEAQPNLLQSLR